jgi:hypothetical protein
MRKNSRAVAAASVLMIAAAGLFAAPAARTLTCVGLYSETDAGQISYRIGAGNWIVIKVGDKIPANAEIRINVERDWIEVIPTGKPTAVYEITGPESEGGEVIKKVAEILKTKPKTVSFPKVKGGAADPKFKNKLVVTQYLGRQVYVTPDLDEFDIKYGDVLDRKGTVRITATNTTITLMNAGGKVTKVIGPLKFEVEKVLTNQKLYKFLNVAR